MNTNNQSDIRWRQRLSNFKYALIQLQSAVEIARARSLSDLEKQGLIQAFEFTHELGWNVIKDYLEDQGATSIMGSRDATREGFRLGIIVDGDQWMEMIRSRNQTSHTYNKGTAEEIVLKILESYFVCFLQLQTKLDGLASK
jgi:nucleotidyltransferase substrate binding protein (TIGR01987 family)